MTTKKKDWNGKIHVISDERFFALLTDIEYQLFIGLKSIARHNGNGQSYLYYNQIGSIENLSDELRLAGRVDGTIMQRKVMSKTIKSLIEKGILIENKCFYEENGEKFGGYNLINENEMKYKFAKINNDLLKAMRITFKGNVLKLYVYIKANFDFNKKNNNETYFKRETLAKAINEVSKKGEIGKRQLDNITMMLRVLYTMGLIDIKNIKVRNNDGSIREKLKIVNVTDVLKDYR